MYSQALSLQSLRLDLSVILPGGRGVDVGWSVVAQLAGVGPNGTI